MMDDVPENEWQNSPPPALREQGGQLPAPRTPPQPAAPAEIDPEQVRQFQQFQQFQELMRQQGGMPLVPSPPKPLWKKALTSKAVRKFALFAIFALLLYIAYDYYFGSNNEDLPASMTGGGKTDTNLVLDTNPYETVRKVYHHIAQNVPQQACGRFTTDAARQFANDFNAADCAAAVSALHKEVTGRNGYAEVDFRGKMGQTPDAGVVEISSCELGVSNGPRLGVFTVNRIQKDQWIITAHRTETCR
jgi:hypothetical protein